MLDNAQFGILNFVLFEAEVTEMTIAAQQLQKIPSLKAIKDLAFSGRVLWEPESRWHEAVDLVMEPNVALQITVPQQHTPLNLTKTINNLQVCICCKQSPEVKGASGSWILLLLALDTFHAWSVRFRVGFALLLQSSKF